MTRFGSVAVAAVLLGTATAPVQAATFDPFTVAQGPVTSTGGSVNSGFAASPTFAPYQRSVSSFLNTSGQQAAVTSEVDASGSGTFRSVMTDLLSGDRGDSQLTYQLPVGVSPVDLAAMGDRFVVGSVEATSQFQFLVSVGPSQFADVTVGPTSGAQDVEIPFSSFSNSPDFTANGGVNVFIRRQSAGDASFTMDSLSIVGPAAVIPLPATGLMLIGALGGLAVIGAARRRTG